MVSHSGARACDTRLQLFEIGDDTSGVTQDVAALFGHHHPASVTVEKASVQLIFEHPNLTAQGWLGNAKAAGGLVRGAEFGDVDEGPKLCNVHQAI
jgi:hypothetical protein